MSAKNFSVLQKKNYRGRVISKVRLRLRRSVMFGVRVVYSSFKFFINIFWLQSKITRLARINRNLPGGLQMFIQLNTKVEGGTKVGLLVDP